MRTVTYALFWLPNRNPRGKPYKSGWLMTEAEAKALGALGQVPGTAILREVPDTPEEVARSMVAYQSAGHDSVKPPRQ